MRWHSVNHWLNIFWTEPGDSSDILLYSETLTPRLWEFLGFWDVSWNWAVLLLPRKHPNCCNLWLCHGKDIQHTFCTLLCLNIKHTAGVDPGSNVCGDLLQWSQGQRGLNSLLGRCWRGFTSQCTWARGESVFTRVFVDSNHTIDREGRSFRVCRFVMCLEQPLFNGELESKWRLFALFWCWTGKNWDWNGDPQGY